MAVLLHIQALELRHILKYKKMKIFLFFTFFWCFTGCGSTDEAVLKSINVELSHINNIGSYKLVFIIPSQGCGSCISGAEAFMLGKYQESRSKGILFIITGHSSLKSAVVRFGKFIENNKNIYIDIEHQFDRVPFVDAYPKILLLKNGQVYDTKELKPESSNSIYNELNQMI